MENSIQQYIDTDVRNAIQQMYFKDVACFLSALAYHNNVAELFADNNVFTLLFNGNPSYPNYAFIVEDFEGNFYLAIRGSIPPAWDWDSIVDWLKEDLNVYCTHNWLYPAENDCWVAQGGWDAFQFLCAMMNHVPGNTSSIDDILSSASQSGNNVIIAGHSLGGNMAKLFASYFSNRLITQQVSTENLYLCTFAAPASGNQNFASLLDGQLPAAHVTHYEGNNDVIPQFPVYATVNNLQNFFSPSPLATSICLLDVCLSDWISGIADSLQSMGYVKGTTGLTILTSALSSEYTQNSFDDWEGQAAYQHAISTYASLLGVPLPVLSAIKSESNFKSAFASVD